MRTGEHAAPGTVRTGEDAAQGVDRPARAGSGWPELHPTTQAAYNLILWNRGLSKSEVARGLGLSRTRLTAIARDLEAAGLIVEGGRRQRASTGRPAEMLLPRTDLFHFLGVHVRASELVVAGIDLINQVVWERRQRLDGFDASVVGAYCRAWLDEARAAGLQVAALAVCGSTEQIDGAPDGVGLHAVVTATVRAAWQRELGIPVWAEDDVVALTAFEQWPRLADGQESMALISFGAEIGFGLVADRRIIVGAHRRAGRFSHVRVAADGARCPRGHRGCLWAESSTTSIVAGVAGARTLREVIERATAGEEAARERLRRAARGMGVATGHILNLLDPDKVLLTGDSPSILDSRGGPFEEGLREVSAVSEPSLIEVTAFDVVDWARAAAGLALYRRLAGASHRM